MSYNHDLMVDRAEAEALIARLAWIVSSALAVWWGWVANNYVRDGLTGVMVVGAIVQLLAVRWVFRVESHIAMRVLGTIVLLVCAGFVLGVTHSVLFESAQARLVITVQLCALGVLMVLHIIKRILTRRSR